MDLAAIIIIVLICIVAAMLIHLKNLSYNAQMEQFKRMEKELLNIKKAQRESKNKSITNK